MKPGNDHGYRFQAWKVLGLSVSKVFGENAWHAAKHKRTACSEDWPGGVSTMLGHQDSPMDQWWKSLFGGNLHPHITNCDGFQVFLGIENVRIREKRLFAKNIGSVVRTTHWVLYWSSPRADEQYSIVDPVVIHCILDNCFQVGLFLISKLKL